MSRESDRMIEQTIYEKHYELFEKITKIRGKKPVVINSEQLASYPEETMRFFSNQVGIQFKDSMIQWPSLKQGRFDPRTEWNDSVQLDTVERWYKNAITSTHFISAVRDYKVDEKGIPTFEELDESCRSWVKQVYENFMPYYKKLNRYCISI